MVTAYQADVDLLQPGTLFELSLTVTNLGIADAKNVTMVLGGGTSSVTNDGGTPGPGGVSGSSGDLANFAPLNSSQPDLYRGYSSRGIQHGHPKLDR